MDWGELVDSLWDQGLNGPSILPGTCVMEWLELVRCDYDDVDRMMIESETMGG